MKSSQLTLPSEEFAEKVTLGAILTYGSEVMHTVRGVLEPDDFLLRRHRDIWGACCACYDADGRCDVSGVYMRLREIGKHDSAGGLEYISTLIDESVPGVGIEREVSALKKANRARRLMRLCDMTMQRCALGEGPEAETALLSELQQLGVREDSGTESTRELIDRIGVDELLRPSRDRGGLRLPWGKLQQAISGLRGGQMIVVSAYTSRGKSSLACQIASHCTRQDTGVFYWSTEMSPESLFRRMIDQMSGSDGLRHRDAALSHAEMERAHDAIGWLYDHPIWFDRNSRNVTSMLANLRHVRSKGNVGLVVVDHLQHVRGIGRASSRAQEVSEISRSLKMAALDFDVPFLVVSQVSRPNEDNKPLSIHMLKESGDVENDADVILLLNCPKPAGLAPVSVALNVAKQREGPAGFDITLVFHPSTQRFDSEDE